MDNTHHHQHFKLSWWQFLQSLLAGIILLVLGALLSSYNKIGEQQNDIKTKLELLQAGQDNTAKDLTAVRNQVAIFGQLAQNITRVEVKQEESERRLENLESKKR